MTRETVVNETTKNAGEWTSRPIQVEWIESQKAILHVIGTGLVDEPASTEMLLSIQRSTDGLTWLNMVSCMVVGQNGKTPRKPITLSCTIDDLAQNNDKVRTVTKSFDRFRFGLDVEII